MDGATDEIKVSFTVNRKAVEIVCSSDATLLEVLRDQLRLTGTKHGCGVGECGACTVILNGKAVNSCLILAGSVEGQEVLTIEGLAEDDLHPIQRAFIEEGAVQCGYCTPGMILSAKALLDENPAPSQEEVKVAISGNLCRCTGYHQIVSAILKASQEIAGRG
ncbi:(2Fe-2S)-binding protein [Candidatus Formimonas warabiya]|uniref:(2Fe-2S)-binding protein n=1 Tax=Formimonas warabiya TaxID=1761012 RepID=A0A3G1KXF6_FORW1|nr:(2Fe-2S)-binding protein [Candidatus Formimonas warabiya]ATW27164.1 (2Fe-2S)-binding protein [Candidatus Formimonas warabiya]